MSHEDDFPDTEFSVDLECPMCGAEVAYEDVLSVDDPAKTGCPVCGGQCDTDEWFA